MGLTDFPVDFTATAYFNNSGSPLEQNLSASDTVYLPVTIEYVYPTKTGDLIDVDFRTVSETANQGFNIYAIKGKKWIRLNDEIVVGALDAFVPQDYAVSVEVPEGLRVKKIGIADVDLKGHEVRHGPFPLNKESGMKTQTKRISWKSIKDEVKKQRAKHKKAKAYGKGGKKGKGRLASDDSFEDVTLNVAQNARYRVTNNDLLAAGVDLTGQKVKNIALLFRGESVARYIGGTKRSGKWGAESYIEFMGSEVSPEDALYVDANHYKIVFDKKQVTESGPITPLQTTKTTFETNRGYAYVIAGDDPFYEGLFYTFKVGDRGNYNKTFDMPALPEEGTVALHIDTSAISEGTHRMEIALNGAKIAESTKKDAIEWLVDLDVENSYFHEGQNTLTLTLLGEDDGLDRVIFDKMSVTYDTGADVDALHPEVDVSEPVAAETLAIGKGTDYLIIAHPHFLGDTLDAYVTQRESEGWHIKVADVEDVYALYDGGMQTPKAIKAYIQDAINKGVTHVQLVGAASYDYHDYLGTGSISFIPSIYVFSSEYVHFTPCDSCYVSAEEDVPAAAIGRWPVRTLDELAAVVNKSLAWSSSGQDANRFALLIADQTDGPYNFAKQMNALANTMTRHGWDDIEKVYLDTKIYEAGGNVNAAATAARSEIMSRFAEAPSIVSYNGHGSMSLWSFSRLLQQSDAPSINNAGAPAIVLPFACQTTYADSPYQNTFAHQLLAAGENGAAAVYGAATMSRYADNGVVMGKVYEGMSEGKTIGMAIKDVKCSLGSSYRDVIRNGNLLGDVTLKMK